MRFTMGITLALALLFSANSFSAEQHKVEGVVKGIKSADKKITISHGPIKSLGMDGMTMDFAVFDPSMLDEVKAGHKVSFMIEVDKKGDFIITEIEDQGKSAGAMSGEAEHTHKH